MIAKLGKTVGLFLVPLVLLGLVIAVFLATGGAGLNVSPAAPVETLTIEKPVIHEGFFELRIQNTSPESIVIAQVGVRDGFVPFSVAPGPSIPRLGSAVVHIPYPWVEGEAYDIKLFTANSVPFEVAIEVATLTKTPDLATLGSLTLVGIYVGVIPIFLGIFWLPALRTLGKKAFTWLMALTVGLLLYLGIDATSEALEQAAEVGGPFQGIGLVAIGLVATALLLHAIARVPSRDSQKAESDQRLKLALMISVGIGLHNFGEGLAIGAAFAVGAASLGTFLVIGFILQNITEGLGIIAPLVSRKPSWSRLGLLGLIGGAPAIVGTWVGGLVFSPVFSLLFLAIGAGAVFEVAYEIALMIRRDSAAQTMRFTIASGVVAGMLVLYLTGVAIK